MSPDAGGAVRPPGAREGSAREPRDRVGELLMRRTSVNHRFFTAEAERIAPLCHRMAERFARGGRLVALGLTPAARSDVRHVAVEFVHPVIVGKRALPAIGLTPDAGPLPLQVDLVARPDDIAVAFGGEVETARAVGLARERGCLTIAFDRVAAEWEFLPPTDDPFVRQEVIETLYHVLWELVHVFFEHRGLLSGRPPGRAHDVGASRFLYPFLDEGESDLESVMADVRGSVLLKAREVGELRTRTFTEGAADILAAAAALRRAFGRGGTLLAFGNGGSATDAMDVVADFRAAPGTAPGGGTWVGRRALDLTEDASILTAIANDVGPEAIFARQVIAYGGPGDVVLALSTSGGSRNVTRGLAEARTRGLATIALVGYDGGEIRERGLADHVVVAPSEHVPRIQEAHASVYHVLRVLAELVDGPVVGGRADGGEVVASERSAEDAG